MMYTINYHTGTGNEVVKELDNAMIVADNNSGYTQECITIEDENGKEIAKRSWHDGMDGFGKCENPIAFGDAGFYDDWQFN